MEKRVYDQDEILIRKVLENQFPQDFNITEGVVTEMKTKRVIRTGLVAALIAVSMMAVTVSAAYHMGAFERLAALIGQERADELTPLEITPVELELHDDIAIELVAIEVTDNVAYVYITMQDLVSNRLDGDFVLRHSIMPAIPTDKYFTENNITPQELPRASYINIGTPEIIHRDENGIVTLKSRFESSHTLEGLVLTYGIMSIQYDMFYEPLNIVELNLTDFAVNAPTALMRTRDDINFSSQRIPSREEREIIRQNAVDHFIPVLAPHSADIKFDSENLSSTISSIGLVDGVFRIQTYNPATHDLISFNLLPNDIDINSEDIWQNMIYPERPMRFKVDDDGIYYRDDFWSAEDTYTETIFDIDLNKLNEYVLVMEAHGYESIDFTWDVTFGVNN